MIKVGDKVMVRDAWIEAGYMVPPGLVVDVAYYKNTEEPFVFLVQFENHKSQWFHTIALKTQ